MKKYLIILFFFISLSSFAQENKPQNVKNNSVDINGYIQVRGVSNFADYTSFQIRRFKIWIKSKPEFSEHWSYKIQTTFSSLKQEHFFLQDVKLAYKIHDFSVEIGQFVPEYSLERFESDYKLPVIERAKVINCLIPNGTLGVRDVGLQANFHTKNKILETHFGLFNGYGVKHYNFENQGFMLTNKSSLNLDLANNSLQFGYSVMYRKAEKMSVPKLLPDTVSFSGIDLRYNLFAKFKNKWLELQAEFLNARLIKQNAFGYYLLSAVNFDKNQLVFSYEDYHDLISTTNDKPYFRIGYNYYINSYKLRFSLDNFFQINNKKLENYILSMQIQVFLK